MNKALFSGLIALTSFLAAAPGARAEGVLCSLGAASSAYSPLDDQPAPARATRDLKRLVTLLCPKGCGRVGLYRNASIPNAMTVNVGNGNSKIAYSAAFLERVRSTFGADASFGVLAHEFGHHVDLNGSPVAWMNPSWSNELRADAWAGCALAKAGLKTEGLKGAVRAVAAYPSATDPTWDVRWSALQQGYAACSGGTGMKLAAIDTRTVVARVGGCANNTDCRVGRLCLDGRCQDRPGRAVCLKDVDCPDSQICSPAGRCDQPTGTGSFAGAGPAPAPTRAEAQKSEPSKSEAVDCRKQCELDQRRCRTAAVKSLNDCLRKVTGDASFKACSCPSPSADNAECPQVCEDGFDKADRCEMEYAPMKEACLSRVTSCRDCR